MWKWEDREDGIEITGYIGNETDVVVPEEIDGKKVLSIGYEAFSPNEQGLRSESLVKEGRLLLNSVKLPFSLSEIGSIFNGCACLQNVEFSESVKEISREAFYGCESLQVTEYESAYYLGCGGNPYYALISIDKKAETVTLHKDVKVIAYCVFEDRYFELNTLKVPAELKKFPYENLRTISEISRDAHYEIMAPADSDAIRWAKKNCVPYVIADDE